MPNFRVGRLSLIVGKWQMSGSRERGVEFKGGSLHDGFGGFDGFGGSGEHLTLRLLVLKNTQKNPRVRKIRVRNSGAGNGCANFMDAWKNASVLQEKAMSLVLRGGGGILGLGGGGSADFIFMGAGIFLKYSI